MEGGMNLMEMWNQMGWVAKAIAFILFFMSFWSVGVAVERIFTFTQARKQSKLYAPQVAKHLKDGRLKDAIAVSQKKDYKYSHLAKVVLAGLQEYQFQQDSGGGLAREDMMDTVRRAIQRAAALTASDLKKGVPSLATIGRIVGIRAIRWVCSALSSASSTHSSASQRLARAASARYLPASRKRSSRPRSVWLWRFRPFGSTIT